MVASLCITICKAYVSGKESNFSSEIGSCVIIILQWSRVKVLKRCEDLNQSTIITDTANNCNLCLCFVIRRGSEHDSIANLPIYGLAQNYTFGGNCNILSELSPNCAWTLAINSELAIVTDNWAFCCLSTQHLNFHLMAIRISFWSNQKHSIIESNGVSSNE